MRASDPVQLGRTDVIATRLGLGTAVLGGLYEPVAAATAHGAIARALELGIRYVDTAPLYGYGASERHLGNVLQNVDRSSLVLSTKVGRLLRTRPPHGRRVHNRYRGVADLQPVFDFSREGILRSLDSSLARVGVDRFDMLLVHDPDDHVSEAVETALPTLHELRARGVVRAIGVGTNSTTTATRLVCEGDVDCVLIANRFTLLDQSALDELLPACQERGVAVIAAGVFNSGVLADPRKTPRFDYEPASPGTVARALELEAVCGRHGVPLRAAALQFPLLHPAVTCVLPGCRSPGEVDDAVALFESPINPTLWNELQTLELLPAAMPLGAGV